MPIIVIRPLLITSVLLLIPFIGNRTIEGWNWTWSDFVFAGLVIVGVCLAYEFISRRSNSTVYRAAVALGLLTGFLVLWVTAAVGIIGEDNPGNLLYLVMLMVGFLVALKLRFEPKRMPFLLFFLAAVQMLIPTVSVFVWPDDFAPGVLRVLVLNAGFATFWIASGLLFQLSAEKRAA